MAADSPPARDAILIVDFGIAGHPAHRAARPRGGRLLRDRPLRQGRRGVRQAAAERRHPFRRPRLGARGGKSARAGGGVLRRRARARHLLRADDDGRAARRPVESGHFREFGRALVDVRETSRLFDGVWSPGERHTVWMSHGDRITALPPGFSVKGTSENAPFALIENEARRYLRADVPPGGGAHAGRRKAPRQFRPQHRRPRGRLDDGAVPRRGDRTHPRRRWATGG